jgi:hypothetical protein
MALWPIRGRQSCGGQSTGDLIYAGGGDFDRERGGGGERAKEKAKKNERKKV